MNDNLLDDKIKTVLLKDSDRVVEFKSTVWSNLEDRIKNIELGSEKVQANRRKSVLKIASVAAALVLIFLFGTNPGQAAVKKIRNILIPEKTVEQNIEGQKEETQVSLQESEKGYTVYIDLERYELKSIDGKDRITPKLTPSGNYPEVFLEIEQVSGTKPEALVRQIEAQLEGKYKEVKNVGPVNTPLPSIQINAKSGVKWNDVIERINLVDDKKGGTIVITQHYFVEAEEGHGARFENMLTEFRLKP